MVHVIATIQYKAEREADLLGIYQDFVPRVREEAGCIQYVPTRDLEAGLPNQSMHPAVITVTEIWESMEAFKAHLQASHVLSFREQIQGIVENVTVKVLSPLF